MTPKEKYSEEKDELKASRKMRILESAFALFSEKGIDTIAMTDIAKRSEIGVASLYRYYETKDEIAIRTAIWAWEQRKIQIETKVYEDNFENLNGFLQFKKICSMFVYLYENENQFLRFIYFFDSFAVRNRITKERLQDYEKIIISVQNLVENTISKGISDGSINKEYADKKDILYFSIMHALFSAAQKLSLSGNLLEIDTIISGKKELNLIIDLLTESIKNK